MRLKIKTPRRTFGYEVPQGKASVVIGGRESDDICIDDDPKISSPHLRLEQAGEAWTFTDLMSDKGTLHNGDLQPSARLAEGDNLRLGDTLIEILAPDAPLPALPQIPPGSEALMLELFMALCAAAEKQKTHSYLAAKQREREIRELAQKAVAKGPPERVKFVWLPLAVEDSSLMYELEEDITGKGEIDEEDLSPKEKDLLDFLIRKFVERSRVNVHGDFLARTRLKYAVEDAVMELDETGFAEVSLPYFAASNAGPHHLCLRLEREGLHNVIRQWRDYQPAGATPADALYATLEARFKADHKREYLDPAARSAVAAVAAKMRAKLPPNVIAEKVLPMLRGEKQADPQAQFEALVNEASRGYLDDADKSLIAQLVARFKAETGVDLSQHEAALGRLERAAHHANVELIGLSETEINLPFLIADSTGPRHLLMRVNKQGPVDTSQTPGKPAVAAPAASASMSVMQWILWLLIVGAVLAVLIWLDV